tara:strand:- start:220 stop:342 length:123 start_codon:yes stop_codon:yes gene_type:complete
MVQFILPADSHYLFEQLLGYKLLNVDHWGVSFPSAFLATF